MTFDPFGDFETEGYLRNFEKEKDIALRAMNMLREYANNVPFETRGLVVQVGGNSFDNIAMGHKLGLPRNARRTLCPCQLIHRGITDLALHRFAVVHHRECER